MTYGLIAMRLGHSFSADIHRALCGYDYELKELAPEALAPFLKERAFKGINVTIPYKEAVIPLLDEVDPAAACIGAVNTIVNDNGRLVGYNTDFLGLMALIERSGISLSGKKVLVLGSGGTSKTAAVVAERLHCAEVLRVSRTGQGECITYAEALCRHKDAHILINTTPCGMFPQLGNSAVHVADFPRLEGVVDVVYNPLRTQLVVEARRRGIPAVGGLYMLAAQAAYAAERFVGQTIPQEKVDSVYRFLQEQKQNLVLIGMPSCGKSTIGRVLAEETGRKFVDTDAEIVRQEGRSIPAIFEAVGEAGFREIEARVIRQVSTMQGAVIATGGGAVLRQDNRDLLSQNGRVYFIDRPLEQLVASDDRPLSGNRQALEQRYHERYHIYCGAADRHIHNVAAPMDAVINIQEDYDYEIAHS